jgi:predicted O-methyltransferase YrrM
MNKSEFTKLTEQLSGAITGELEFESFNSIKSICEKSQPKTILELGFNRGVSAVMWLENSKASLHSIDIRSQQDIESSINYIQNAYPDRFTYTCMDHALLSDIVEEFKDKYDLIFIDGDHSYDAIYRDTKNSIQFNPTFIAFDDYFHAAHGHDTKKVIEELNLEIIEEYNTSCGHVLTKLVK